jgi:hypothetical protein
MKRSRPPKRRDRRASKTRSPYTKYAKAPYLYSAGHREWQRQFTKGEAAYAR